MRRHNSSAILTERVDRAINDPSGRRSADRPVDGRIYLMTIPSAGLSAKPPRRVVHGPVCLFLLFSFFLVPTLSRAEETPRKIVLTDGVRLVLKPEAVTDTVAITLFVRAGSDSSANEDATGELVSRAFLYGNENSSFESIAETVNDVGGRLETFRTTDTVAVRIVTNGSRIADAAYLLAQALKNANFSRDALSRAVRDVVNSQQPRPAEAFADALATGLETLRASFRPYPIPDSSLLRRVTPEMAQAYFRERYTPERTVISLVGNFNPRQAASIFDDNFFDFRRVSQRPIIQRQAGVSADFSAEPLRMETTTPVGIALVAIAPPALDSTDYPAFLTINALLGAGHASRLFQSIRDRQGIGYDVNAAYRPTAPELWTAYLQWDAGKNALTPDAALKLLNTEISGMTTRPPTDAELIRARALAIASLALRSERARDESFLLAWHESMGVGYNFDTLLPRRIEAVTRQDVLRVAREFFTRRAALLAIPPKP